MTVESLSAQRVRVDGKFFRLGETKFFLKGVTYGPFAPNAKGEMFATPEQTRLDFGLVKELGANVLRVYYVPPRWFLDLAQENLLKVLIDLPWGKHLCFLDSTRSQQEARQAVRRAVWDCRGHPAVFAFSVVNEIPAEIARWSGVERVQRFLTDLVEEVKEIDPDCLCTCTSFPSTEFLRCENADFSCFNVYLHDPKPFEGYLARLQTLAGARPLVLGEFGMDSIREGEQHKGEFLRWQLELAFRSGLAGAVIFSFTDDWFRGGFQIEDWGFGLTTRSRVPKDSFRVVQSQFRTAPYFPLARCPKVSVVVATYNGSRTLRQCLESLMRVNYSDYEVIIVDDGSTDGTSEIARAFPSFRYLHQANQGLSAARNTGIRAALGEIVAFTDDDCRPDEDWLHYLVQDLVRGDFAGIGGHNFLPPDDSSVAAVIMASPGGPAHVLLTDREAEHIPGCNMAFYKWALEQVGLFDPLFRKAGDDVDLCWRLQDANLKIGFSPAGFVWHYRRSTLKAYTKQQTGYGEAEALLIGKHPEHYNPLGGGIWRGRIYASSLPGLLLSSAAIYHGIFGSGFFQKMYAPNLVPPFMYCTSLVYHVFVNIPLLALAINFVPFVPLAVASMGVSLGTCILAAVQAPLPRHKKRFWSRPLIALLFFMQPIARDWARFKWRINLRPTQSGGGLAGPAAVSPEEAPERISYWSEGRAERYQLLAEVVTKLNSAGWAFRIDTGWAPYDIEILPRVWSRVRLTTVSEELGQGKRTFHCRLERNWSLLARVTYFIAATAVIMLIVLFGAKLPWLWFSLTALPLLWWAFEDESLQHASALAGLINAAALKQSFVEIGPESSQTATPRLRAH